VPQISLELLNRFAPNSPEDVFGPSLGRVSRSKIKIAMDKKRAFHSHHPPASMEWNVLAANAIMQWQMGLFHRCREG